MGSRNSFRLAASTAITLLTIGGATAFAQDEEAAAPAEATGSELPATPATSPAEESQAPGAAAIGEERRAEGADEAEAEKDAKGTGKQAGKLRQSKTAVRLKGLKGGKLVAGKKIKVAGTLRPFVKGERVRVVLMRRGKAVAARTTTVKPKRKKGSDLGQFGFAKKLVKPGRYSVKAIHRKSADLGTSTDKSRGFKIKYPSLRKGNRNDSVKLFNNLLAGKGYVNDRQQKFDSATGRAVLAFRKVNNMARTEKANSKIFKMLAKGKGGFKLKHPGAGKHVEADLSRQVLVLANGGKVDEIYHISSGAPATPTITGSWRFYRKEPGTNSLGMVNSVYYVRGYATHGYHSVPTYPASHGCLRNPIPDSRHIYNWIDLGDKIFVYR